MENKRYALWLTFICIIVFIIQLVSPAITDIFLLNKQALTQPWRFLTAMFLHGSLLHLLYNGFALALFGSILEHTLGSKRFVALFVITGIFANLVSVWFYPSSLGASGAIFGVIGALVVLRPGMTVWAFSLPMPMFVAGIVWAIGDIIGVFVPSDVANLAHLTGMGAGIVFGFFYRIPRHEKRKEEMRLDETTLRSWEDNYLR